MTNYILHTCKNTCTSVESAIPKTSEAPEISQTQDNGSYKPDASKRRSVEGPEDYVSHDTDDLK